jgi:NADH-quinone oxidoreductase subunit L
MAGPTPVSALIHAATMVTAGIFMITRLNYLFDLAPDVQNIIAIIGAVTSLVAATIALVQTDKKVLAYSTVLNWVDVLRDLAHALVAVFHVITHVSFKASLF